MVLPGLISVAAATVLGLISWRGSVWAIGLAALVPTLIFLQHCRSAAGKVALLYFATASWPITTCTRTFWSLPPTSPLPIGAWSISALLLSLPWVLLWSSDRSSAIWRCPLALIFGIVPPLGLIGWASPLTAAGVLFPGTAWPGIVVTLALPGIAVHRQLRLGAVAFAAVLAAQTNLTWTDPPPPPGWAVLNTTVDSAGRSDPVVDFDAVERIQAWARESSSRVLVAPESAVLRWNEATQDLWQPTAEELKRRHATLLLGTTVAIPNGSEYENLLLGIGAAPTRFVQRNPVPFAMWKPFGPKDGTRLRFSARGTLDIAGQRAAVLICYEQLLVWPVLHSALEQPTLVLGIANNYWCRGTRVAQSQRACMRAWARLFALPVLAAANE